MRKTFGKKHKISIYFLAFIAVAVLFLSLGFGTLGSFRTQGKDYELKAIDAEATESVGPYVVFDLTRTSAIRLDNVYIYTTAIYTESDEPAELTIERSMYADKSFAGALKGTVQNIVPKAPEVKEGEEAPEEELVSDLYRWAAPFTLPEGTWRTSTTYHYVRISATKGNIRIGEIVFVGEKFVDGEGTGEYSVIPASVISATVDLEETADSALKKARALVDAQKLPQTAQSSYENFMPEEHLILLSIGEMRNEYATNAAGTVLNVYNGDRIYGSLGIDILALGTAIFGVSPFGLRFFPMLASFGVLVLGYFMTRRLTKSDLGGLGFAVLYTLCNLSFSLGHLGTPLMIGVFFCLASFELCHRFYSDGVGRANFLGVLPLLLSGLCGAAAICVNGAFVIPVAGVVAVFVLGMLRQQKARRYFLDAAIAEAEGDVIVDYPVEEGEEPMTLEQHKEEGRKNVARVLAEYRFKNVAAPVVFAIALLLGTFIFSLLFMLPVRFAFLKLYDNPANRTMNIFSFAWKAFAGGFAGVNAGATPSAWSFFYTLFTGMGTQYAVTGAIVNIVGAALGACGFVYAIYRLVLIFMGGAGKESHGELRRILVPLCALAVTLIVSAFAKGALAFLLLTQLFAFMLAAQAFVSLLSMGGKAAKIAKIGSFVALGLLVVWFALCFVFTFSIPIPADVVGGILG